MAGHDDMPRNDDPTEIDPRPSPPPMRGPGSTVAQLKQDIDSGATGDKVAMLDPSSTPLGTDSEAAGSSTTPEMVHAMRETERMANPPPGDPGKHSGVGLGGKLLAGLVGAVALALIAVWLG
jgi:hypothetical protein